MDSMQQKYIFDCTQCSSPCDNKSLGKYIFEQDIVFSEQEEMALIKHINRSKKFMAQKSAAKGYPDIEIYSDKGTLIQYLEVKVQRRAFMKIKEMLPNANLVPSETVALNLSDLLRYFEIQKKEKKPVVIVWIIKERICLTGHKEKVWFKSDINKLKAIYEKDPTHTRRFRRHSGKGDMIEGTHLGVTVNYHFSVTELTPWSPTEF